jgi:hypothetical protein
VVLESIELNKKAVEMYNQGRYKDAEVLFKKALSLNPKYAEAYANLGALYAKFKIYQKAIELYKYSIKLKPSYAGAYTNLGNALNKTKRFEEAVYFHKIAISLDNKSANNFSNCASAYKNLGRFDLAKAYYQKAIELDKNHINAHFDLSTVLLQTGEYEKGWYEYEWRFKKEQMKGHLLKYKDIFSKPLYDGRDLKNNEIVLVHAEQGYGDIFMVSRYLFSLKQKGARVYLYLREGLEEIFKTLSCVDKIFVRDKDKLESFDFQIAFMSLPLMLDKNLKNINKYYPYFDIKEKKELKTDTKYNIAIVWGASKTGESYKDKVFDIRYFSKMAKHKDITLFSLQLGDDKEDIKKHNLQNDIVDLSDNIKNFYDTAVYINSCDLVITSDTSVAHLAGAMGKEVWIVLQRVADWRWGVCSEKSIWYKSAKLFRQYSIGDFNSAFKEVYKALENRYDIKVFDE